METDNNKKHLYLAYLEYTCVQYLRDGMNKSYPIIFRNAFTNKIPVILSNSKKRVLIWVEGKKKDNQWYYICAFMAHFFCISVSNIQPAKPSVSLPFDSQKWLTCNFSLKHIYNIQQTGNKNAWTYHFKVVILI